MLGDVVMITLTYITAFFLQSLPGTAKSKSVYFFNYKILSLWQEPFRIFLAVCASRQPAQHTVEH
jgi:hypothetical protein